MLAHRGDDAAVLVFTLYTVLIEVGAGDLSGAGAAAMCADLGARTIRE